MIFSEKTQKAMKICYRLHENQFDRNGNPYVFHLMYVADYMQDEAGCVAALLHQALNEKSCTAEMLKKEGISDEVVATLQILKRSRKESFQEYLDRIKKDPQAKAIKIADLNYLLLENSGTDEPKKREIQSAIQFLQMENVKPS